MKMKRTHWTMELMTLVFLIIGILCFANLVTAYNTAYPALGGFWQDFVESNSGHSNITWSLITKNKVNTHAYAFPIVQDFDNDGVNEIFIADGSAVRIYNALTFAEEASLTFGADLMTTPTTSEFLGNGRYQIVAITTNGSASGWNNFTVFDYDGTTIRINRTFTMENGSDIMATPPVCTNGTFLDKGYGETCFEFNKWFVYGFNSSAYKKSDATYFYQYIPNSTGTGQTEISQYNWWWADNLNRPYWSDINADGTFELVFCFVNVSSSAFHSFSAIALEPNEQPLTIATRSATAGEYSVSTSVANVDGGTNKEIICGYASRTTLDSYTTSSVIEVFDTLGTEISSWTTNGYITNLVAEDMNHEGNAEITYLAIPRTSVQSDQNFSINVLGIKTETGALYQMCSEPVEYWDTSLGDTFLTGIRNLSVKDICRDTANPCTDSIFITHRIKSIAGQWTTYEIPYYTIGTYTFPLQSTWNYYSGLTDCEYLNPAYAITYYGSSSLPNMTDQLAGNDDKNWLVPVSFGNDIYVDFIRQNNTHTEFITSSVNYANQPPVFSSFCRDTCSPICWNETVRFAAYPDDLEGDYTSLNVKCNNYYTNWSTISYFPEQTCVMNVTGVYYLQAWIAQNASRPLENVSGGMWVDVRSTGNCYTGGDSTCGTDLCTGNFPANGSIVPAPTPIPLVNRTPSPYVSPSDPNGYTSNWIDLSSCSSEGFQGASLFSFCVWYQIVVTLMGNFGEWALKHIFIVLIFICLLTVGVLIAMRRK